MSKKKKNHSKSSGNKTARKPEHSGNAASLPEEDYIEEYTEEYADESYGSEDTDGYAEDSEDAGEYYYEEEEEEYYGENGYDGESYEDGDGYSDGDFDGDDNYDGDSIIPGFLRPFAAKCGALFARLDRFLYNKYILPDGRKLVSQKTAITAFSITAAASLIIGFGLIIFLGTYPFHTTGMKTKDFIREFNSITSDTDIRAILPEYSDVIIPENAKLGSEPLYLADGHVKLTARTRNGKILELYVEGVDIPNYDPHNYSFKTEIYDDYDTSNGQFYYYIALGKAAVAAEKLLGNGPFLSEQESYGTSDSDSQDNGTSADSSPEITVYEAASYGYQIYYYAFYYYVNRKNDGYVYLPMGDCYMNFTLSDMTLVIKPTVEKITTLPAGLQRFWDKLTGANKETENTDSVQTVQTQPVEEQQPDIEAETSVSDGSLSPAA